MTESLRTSYYMRETEKTVYRARRKVITSQQFMRAEKNDGLIDDKS